MNTEIILLIAGGAAFIIGAVLFVMTGAKVIRLAVRKRIGLMKRWRWRPARPERVFRPEQK